MRALTKPALARLLLTLTLMAGAATVLSACNTTAGAGQDVSATGRAVTRGADDVKSHL